MFGKNKVKKAFSHVKKDMDVLKGSMNEWTVYLQKNQLDFEHRLSDMEKRIARLEAAIINEVQVPRRRK